MASQIEAQKTSSPCSGHYRRCCANQQHSCLATAALLPLALTQQLQGSREAARSALRLSLPQIRCAIAVAAAEAATCCPPVARCSQPCCWQLHRWRLTGSDCSLSCAASVQARLDLRLEHQNTEQSERLRQPACSCARAVAAAEAHLTKGRKPTCECLGQECDCCGKAGTSRAALVNKGWGRSAGSPANWMEQAIIVDPAPQAAFVCLRGALACAGRCRKV